MRAYIFIQNRGFTFVEVMVSTVILSLAVVGMLVLVMQVVGISKRADYEYTAVTLAQDRLERVRNIIDSSGFDAISSLSETDTRVDPQGVPDTDGIFTRTTTVTTNYDGNSYLTKVKVSVAYYYRGVRCNNPTTITTVYCDIASGASS